VLSVLASTGAGSYDRRAISRSVVVIGNHGAIGERDGFDSSQIIVGVCGGVGWHIGFLALKIEGFD
jgi:hypothetical protein